MKTIERTNPLEGKSFDPNHEPWLTLLELLIEAEVLKECYSKWK